MIQFYAQMYNFTSGEIYDITPFQYSIAQYFGYTGSSELDVMSGKSGQTLSDVPYVSFEGSRGSNIGTWFEYYAKKYFDNEGSWPILQLKTAENYILQWDHSAPNSFTIITPSTRWLWNSAFQWADAFNPNYTDDRKYNLVYSYVFVKSSRTSDLISSEERIFSGAYCYVIETTGFEVLVAYNPDPIVEVSNSLFLKTSAGDYLGTLMPDRASEEIVFTKKDDGIAIFVWRTLLAATAPNPGPLGIAPYYNSKIMDGWAIEHIPDRETTPTIGTFSEYPDISWAYIGDTIQSREFSTPLPVYSTNEATTASIMPTILNDAGVRIYWIFRELYDYLTPPSDSPEPPSDVDPTDIPPEDDPPEPINPDNPDPYYDPTSDPDNPDYDPTKDPSSPSYDPTQPSTPYRPPTTEGGGNPPVQPPQDEITVPEVPPSFVTNNALFTLYNPSGGDLNSLANFLWSPQWSIDTFKKIFANPLDCILGLMVMPFLPASTSTKEMAVGNIATGVIMRYFTNQFYDFDCGTFRIEEYYASYLDYAPYTDVSLYLPYIGDQRLNTDEVMNKTIGIKYRFDLATGDCVAFVSVDGSVLYSFSGNCASRLPLSSNNWSGMLPAFTGALTAAGSVAAGIPALGAAAALAVTSMKQKIAHSGSMSGSPGLMGVQTPYLIITRPRQALPISQNSFTGYPSFITESMGSLSGYTEVEACHLEHVPCTGEELKEIERLLKEGVLF